MCVTDFYFDYFIGMALSLGLVWTGGVCWYVTPDKVNTMTWIWIVLPLTESVVWQWAKQMISADHSPMTKC